MKHADHGTEAFLRVAIDRKRAEEWALVLVAEGMSAAVRRSGRGYLLTVPRRDAQRAAAALSAYDEEPARRLEPPPVRRSRGALAVALTVPLALIGFWLMTRPGGPWRELFARGSADSGAILSGEWWRALTGLTLHAGLAHVLSNGVAIALFLGAACMTLGAGLGSLAVLLSGALGNLLNALLHGAPHNAAGASTAVFGAVGLLGGLGVARRVRSGTRGRRAWVPMAAGLGLLAMLGTSGARVDVWAHLFGLIAGGLLGLPLGSFVHSPPELRRQWLLGFAALSIVVYSWIRALS